MSKIYQERSKERKTATYDIRRQKALAEGTRVEYVTCPLCGRNRPLQMWGTPTRFEVKPDYAVVQVRYGGGRGIGFFLSQEESAKLEDLQRLYPDLFDNLKEEIAKLNTLFSKLGKT